MHNPIQKISLLIFEGLASLRDLRSWLPLFYFWVICALALGSLTQFTELPFSGWIAGGMMKIFGAEVVEYPRFYLHLPDIQRKLYLVLALSLGALFRGATLLHLIRYHSRRRIERPRVWLRSFSRLPGHILMNLLGLTLFLLPLLAFRFWLAPVLANPDAARAAYLACYALGFLAQCFLIYAPLLYLSFRSSVKEALGASIGFARQHFGVSLGLILIPFLLTLPLGQILIDPKSIAEYFRPELILWLLLLTSFLNIFIVFLQLSTIARFYANETLREPIEAAWDATPSRNPQQTY